MEFLGYPFEGIKAAGEQSNFVGFFVLPRKASGLSGSLLLRLRFRLGRAIFFFADFSANSSFVLTDLFCCFSVRGNHFRFGFFLAQPEVFKFFDRLGVGTIWAGVSAASDTSRKGGGKNEKKNALHRRRP